MNGHGPGTSEQLEEIVIGSPKVHARKRSSKEELRSPTRRVYPKGDSLSDAQDGRPLLQHASSEPSSRLQFFALSNRLFQPHSRDSRDLDAADEEGGCGSGTAWLPKEDIPSLQLPLPGQTRFSKDLSDTRPDHTTPQPAKFRRQEMRRASIGSGGARHSSVSSKGDMSHNSSDFRSLPDGPEFIKPKKSSESRPSAQSGSDVLSAMASNGLTAGQLLGKEEQIRSLMRGCSLNSTGSLRSSSKGAGPVEPSAGVAAAGPRVVSLADVNLEAAAAQHSGGALPLAVRSLAQDKLPIPVPHLHPSVQGGSRKPRRVSWRESHGSQPAEGTPVVDHLVAGDLHLGSGPPKQSPAPNLQVESSRSSKAGNQKKKGNLTPRSSDLQFEDEEKDKNAQSAEEAKKMHWWDFWKHYQFWSRWVPVILTLALFAVGTAVFIWKRGFIVAYFELWRWSFFLGCILPLYWASHLVVHGLVVAVESTLFTTKQVLYYTYGVRKPLARFIRVCLVLPVFVGCFSGRANDGAGVQKAYVTMTRLMGCLILFFFANVLKTLVAKLLSTHFHKEAHFRKMQEALQKEYYIMSLSQPRAGAIQPSQKGPSPEGEGQAQPELQKPLPQAPSQMQRATGVYDKLMKGLPKMKKTGSLPDMVQAAEVAHERERHDAQHAGVRSPARVSQDPVPGPQLQSPSPALGPQVLPTRTSWQNPLKSFHGRHSFNSQTPSMMSRAGPGPRGNDSASVAPSQRTIGGGPKFPTSRTGKFLLRTGAFKKQLPAADEVTTLTTALEGVKDTSDSKEFNGDLIKKLHIAEKHIRKNKLKVTFADQLGSAAHSGGGEGGEVASKQEAKKLAFYLFWNVKPFFDRNYILQEDIEYFLPPHKAAKAFELLDRDQDGRVSLHDIRDAILQIYKERKDLALTLKDTKTIVGKLENIVAAVVHIIFVMFYLLIFAVDVSKVWISFSSIVVAFSFIFAKAISDMFVSVVFLFVVHPFDVGDGIMIGSDMHFVEEISLQNCVLKRWDGARVWYPNTVMLAAPVTNITRSGCKWESFIMYLDISTPAEVFNVLRRKIEEHMEANAGELSGEFACCNFGCGDPLKIKLGVYFEYTHSGTDLGRLNVARHGLATCICQALVALGVRYSLPSFSGPRQPGLGDAAFAEMARPLAGAHAATVVQQAAATLSPAAAHQAAVRGQYPGAPPAPHDALHPPFLQHFSS